MKKIFYVLILMFSLKVICVYSKPLIEELLHLLLPDVDYPDEFEFYPGYQGHHHHQYPGFNNYYPGFYKLN